MKPACTGRGQASWRQAGDSGGAGAEGAGGIPGPAHGHLFWELEAGKERTEEQRRSFPGEEEGCYRQEESLSPGVVLRMTGSISKWQRGCWSVDVPALPDVVITWSALVLTHHMCPPNLQLFCVHKR